MGFQSEGIPRGNRVAAAWATGAYAKGKQAKTELGAGAQALLLSIIILVQSTVR